MKWEGNRESDNVEDLRGSTGGGGGGGFGIGGKSIGLGTIVIALIGSYFFGIDPSVLLGGGGGSSAPQVQAPRQASGPTAAPADDRQAKFVRTVLADTEDVWTTIFSANGKTYVKPKLDLFTGRVETACGTGQSASGPFYCPGDQKVYIDLAFYRLMEQRFHVSGDFAKAYVIAHEVGHHVQNLLGITAKMDAARGRASEVQVNALSVRLELQADCFAGVWANHANQARSILEAGDVEAALSAATAIGDDTLQRQAQGTVVPDSFTHGSSAQRVRWFKRGIDSGKLTQCDTFRAREL
jgi:predicted metalloprotease